MRCLDDITRGGPLQHRAARTTKVSQILVLPLTDSVLKAVGVEALRDGTAVRETRRSPPLLTFMRCLVLQTGRPRRLRKPRAFPLFSIRRRLPSSGGTPGPLREIAGGNQNLSLS
jgi:hypothetical protein